jgi:Holliday junction DNA helicase RuvB
MEDYAIDIIIGKGPSANSIRLDLPRFTLIGATTLGRPAFLAPARPLRRDAPAGALFGGGVLQEIVTRSAGNLNVPIEPDGAAEIASRPVGPPGRQPHSRRVRDFAQVCAAGYHAESRGRGAHFPRGGPDRPRLGGTGECCGASSITTGRACGP